MSYVEQFQTLSREDAKVLIHSKLSHLALDAIGEDIRSGMTKREIRHAEKRAAVKASNAEWMSSDAYKNFKPEIKPEPLAPDPVKPTGVFARTKKYLTNLSTVISKI